MSPVRNQLIQVIDVLPEEEQTLLLEIARRFMSDDIATLDDLKAIEEARAEYEAGEAIPEDAINWE